MPSGGDITELQCNHPLGVFTFYPVSGEDSTYDLGGIRTDDNMDDIDGSGSPIYKMNRKRASFEVPVSWDMGGNATLEDVVNMAGHIAPGSWVATNINGVVYKINGKPVGDLQGNGNTSRFSLKISGATLTIN